jgi:hypothetical protein
MQIFYTRYFTSKPKEHKISNQQTVRKHTPQKKKKKQEQLQQRQKKCQSKYVKHPNNADFQMNNQMQKAFTLKLRTKLHKQGHKTEK